MIKFAEVLAAQAFSPWGFSGYVEAHKSGPLIVMFARARFRPQKLGSAFPPLVGTEKDA